MWKIDLTIECELEFTYFIEAYSELSQTSKLEFFAKMVNSFQQLTIFAKTLHLSCLFGLWMDFECTFTSNTLTFFKRKLNIQNNLNSLSANPQKWPNTLKPIDYLSVFDHFVGLAFKGLNSHQTNFKSSIPLFLKREFRQD